jgi:hypothetical protein
MSSLTPTTTRNHGVVVARSALDTGYSGDEVDLVDDAGRLAAGDADETPLLSQSSRGAVVSIWVAARNVYSLGSTGSPRPRRPSTSADPWRILRD